MANDYYKLGEFYYKTNRIDASENYLLKSIEMRSENLQMLRTPNDEFYREIYEIGIMFSMIASIEGIENDFSLHASLLACCFLELASLNSNVKDSEETFFLSSYYGGVANHSILRNIDSLGDEAIKKISGTYICDGIRFYERSFEAQNFGKQIDNQYEYINQIVDVGLKYLGKMEVENCLSIRELEDIKNKYPYS